MTHEQIIQEIIKLLNQPGEERTDGECLDDVAELLENNGWKVFEK